ncbi:hypothetical protein B2J86_05765 [Acidovorax sp. SRB_14]|uniref:3-oxo-tetronate kinase n=1 Tax=Acidovorax sp. SRB_14 TaxID=1962699 RepID=UPI00156364F8|nr:3-oxo-tetronate kinase [Acidovorax sp. SRB_14]NMM80439.1 hypothetical protein [Acidovorax sp. SRB_14]
MPLLGCIADDFTGATDLANNLVRGGMRVMLTMGVPPMRLTVDVDAVVVSLKSRTVPVTDAVRDTLNAADWLRSQGARQVYFKYCSTFDSTPDGNIGQVTEALMDALGTDFTIATPAFPDNQRTVFKGHLFVGDVLLHESSMRDHPLTPMTDPNLVRVLQAQCSRKVGLIDYRVVAEGEGAIRARIAQLRAEGVGIAIVDAISNADLARMAPAFHDIPLVTAGSGLASGLTANFGISPSEKASSLPAAGGFQAVVSGSCSLATQRQTLAFAKTGRPAVGVDPLRLAAGEDVVGDVLAWAEPLLKDGPVLVYSTAEAGAVKAVQAKLGVEQGGALIEHAMAAIARGLVERGVRQLVVAGGETSGACVQELGVMQMQIGTQIDPGVPWCHAYCDGAPDGMHIALKSGNFGGEEFFTKAFALVDA